MPKTVVVTGASKGLGKALAIHLAKLGHNVIAIGRSVDLLKELETYPTVKTIAGDLTELRILAQIESLLGNETGVCLVHNAAIVDGIDLDKVSTDKLIESLDQHYAINFKAPIVLTHVLRSNLSGGRVLNISTGLAHRGLAGLLPYGTTKAALYLGSEYLALEFPDVDFASLLPGTIDTGMQEMLRASSFSSKSIFTAFKENGKLRSPEEVAKFVSWVLLNTVAEDFRKKSEWDIMDVSHHAFWTEDKPKEMDAEKKLRFLTHR